MAGRPNSRSRGRRRTRCYTRTSRSLRFEGSGGTVKYTSVSDLLADSRSCLQLNNGSIRVSEPERFREQLVDRLAHTAVFGDDQVKAAARWLIWEAAWELGVQS